MFWKRISRRIRELDQARVDLFDLAPDELPVEAAAVRVASFWMNLFTPPWSPSVPFQVPTVSFDPLPLPSVLLITNKSVRWCPHRTYRGGLVFLPEVDRLLAGEEPWDRVEIYSRFSDPSLGPRSIPLGEVAYVSLDEFVPWQVASVSLRVVTNSTALESEHLNPVYDLRVLEHLGERKDSVEDPPGCRFLALDAASSTFAAAMSQCFKSLEIPFKTEDLETREVDDWHALASMKRKRAWEPLWRRLR